MKELELTNELGHNIMEYMQNKYALTTINQRRSYLKRLFKMYNVLNKETLRSIMKTIKYQHQRAVLSMINNYCYDNEIDFHLIIPKVRQQANTLPTILSIGEIELMIKSAPKPYDLAIRCIFNFGAGLRVSEIIKLSWNDIRWIDWLRQQDSYGVALIKSGKGMKDRVVNIPKNLMKDLYEYAKKQHVLNEFRVPVGKSIFEFGNLSKKFIKKFQSLNSKDEKLKAEFVQAKYNWFRYNIIQKYCEKALNKRLKIHSLRHSRATYLHEYEKVPIESLQILLGHKSLTTTMIYTKVNPRRVFEEMKETTEI